MSTWCMGGMCPNASDGAVAEFTMAHPAKPAAYDKELIQKCKAKIQQDFETYEARLERYLSCLTPSTSSLTKMFDAFVDELSRGLTLHRDVGSIDPKLCSFKMLDSYVKEIPTGKEQGIFYAIDFGGTNLRAVRCELKGSGGMEISSYKTSLLDGNRDHVKGLMDPKATATEMFDFFANTTKKFMQENGDVDRKMKYNVGFTFSFPCSMREIDSATLVEWTKDFETGRSTQDKVEGADVCELLQAAFSRNGVPANVCAVMNDTVGTLLSCAYELDASKYPPARVGVILGTGMNACYYDDTCTYYKYKGNIINIECGNFNRSLPRCNIDMEVDFASANRGAQLLEKMVSGAYLGEICRRTVVKVCQHKCPERAWNMHSLNTETASLIATDGSVGYSETQKALKEVWDADVGAAMAEDVHRICYAVLDRSSALAAVFIAACAHKTGYLQAAMGGVSVGVDGSLYKCNTFYRKRLRTHMENVIGKTRSDFLHLVNADDGSGKGAGVVASQLLGA